MGAQNNYSSAARRDSGGDRVTAHNGGYPRGCNLLVDCAVRLALSWRPTPPLAAKPEHLRLLVRA